MLFGQLPLNAIPVAASLGASRKHRAFGNCGKKFTPGDLTGVIKQSKPFDTELLDVKIVRIEKNSKIVEKTIHLKVERDKSTASTPFSFYNTGKYAVELYKDQDKLGESEIEVTEVY